MAISKKEIAKQQVTRMLEAGNLTIEDVIDIIIEKNAIIGVGLISLGNQLKDYCYFHTQYKQR
jgi:hypothetical protein